MDEGQENAKVEQVEEREAGAPEGAVAAEPSKSDIKELYEATGVKAPVPTGKAKGRPKASSVRAKDGDKDKAGSAASGEEEKDSNDKNKQKDAPASSKDGDSGDDTDSKSKKVGKDSEQVPDEPKEIDGAVRKTESKDGEDSERGGKDGFEQGAERAGQEAHTEGSETEESKDDEGKRPGKSNPEVEKRFQRLTEEKRERDEVIERLQKQLQEKEQLHEQAKVAQEDPEYTIEDFRKVQDSEGNIIDLDSESAELAWRRWKDGYEERSSERETAAQQASAMAEREYEVQRQVMEESTRAYDSIASLMDEYPELVSSNSNYDADFAADAVPIIEESINYLEGTEPGNPDGNLPVITGMKLNPKKFLDALKRTNSRKRSLPLNGVNDNVEARSNVAVPHSRSSDPTVHAANELMKEFNIDKRF